MAPLVLIGIGSNLPCPPYDTPQAVCAAAVEALSLAGWRVLARSRWYASAPVPVSDQPWFVNGVVSLGGVPGPDALLAHLHRIEAAFSRRRSVRFAARTLDLDLLAYGNMVASGGDGGPVLPHPRLHERAFVLLPLADVAPDWRHPVSGLSVQAMIDALPPGQDIRPVAGG